MDGQASTSSDTFREHLAVATQAHEDRLRIHASDRFVVTSLSASHHREAIEDDVGPGQLILPYFGVIEWSSGQGATCLLDANAALLTGEDAMRVARRPAARHGYAALLLTGSAEVAAHFRMRLGRSLVFRPTPALRNATHFWLSHLRRPAATAAELDELALHTFSCVENVTPEATTSPRDLVRRAKEVLHGRYREKLSLDDVAEELGVSPVYLTQAFCRGEGMPLYRYILSLRLSRAMLQLPDCEDITTLAMDLGFSSHSHFSTVVKAHCGVSPSAFRTRLAQFEWRRTGQRASQRTGQRKSAGR